MPTRPVAIEALKLHLKSQFVGMALWSRGKREFPMWSACSGTGTTMNCAGESTPAMGKHTRQRNHAVFVGVYGRLEIPLRGLSSRLQETSLLHPHVGSEALGARHCRRVRMRLRTPRYSCLPAIVDAYHFSTPASTSFRQRHNT